MEGGVGGTIVVFGKGHVGYHVIGVVSRSERGVNIVAVGVLQAS